MTTGHESGLNRPNDRSQSIPRQPRLAAGVRQPCSWSRWDCHSLRCPGCWLRAPLSATGQFSLVLGLLVTVLACLLADAFWFYLGRYRGNQVLALLCRISLEPDSCVRRTQNVFTRYGLRGVLVAKFFPGMSTVAPPLAGMSGISAGRFLLVDAVGSLLYGGCLSWPRLFLQQPDRANRRSHCRIGGSALSLHRRAGGTLHRLQILAAAPPVA